MTFFILSIIIISIFTGFIILITQISKFQNISNKIYHTQDNLLTFDECNFLINKAKNNLQRSMVNSINNDTNKFETKLDNVRTSYQAWLNKHEYSNIINKIIKFISKYTPYPITIKNFEDIQVAKYLPNQEYKYHYDICHPTQAATEHLKSCKAEFQLNKSVRFITVLVYLNDDFNGGNTEFTKLNIKIKPKKGKALLFFNCNLQKDSSVTGLCDVIKNSEHAGLPVKNGEKWIANFWIRLKSFKI